ncbi:hypothetical protein [Aquimarina algiphila]|uniref:hypothetical protein n=1 Tax=Aquimarina algiphila TaxID=2047982 RepID=UPI00232EBB07|nr:hypothetical protein [Aquimarina algiphila]
MKKNLLFACTLVFFSMFIACSDDDTTEPETEFIDQVLQGKIDGESWTFVNGTSSIDDKIHLDLLSTETECGASNFEKKSRIIFSITNAVGIYELKFDFNDLENSQTVTLLSYDEEGTPINNIATEGTVEITDITETKVIGRINARSDDNSFVNGNFEASVCN